MPAELLALIEKGASPVGDIPQRVVRGDAGQAPHRTCGGACWAARSVTALGAPVEFWSLREIRSRAGADGMRGYLPAYGRLGAITDDTQMTLFTAEAFDTRRARRRPPRRLPAVADHPGHDRRSRRRLAGARDLCTRVAAPGNTCPERLHSGRGRHHRRTDQRQQGLRWRHARRAGRLAWPRRRAPRSASAATPPPLPMATRAVGWRPACWPPSSPRPRPAPTWRTAVDMSRDELREWDDAGEVDAP